MSAGPVALGIAGGWRWQLDELEPWIEATADAFFPSSALGIDVAGGLAWIF